MEKAVLLIEHSGTHLRCLLNPEQLEFKRQAGISTRQSAGGTLAGTGLTDAPLLYQGGGHTEFTLDLLFDTSLASSQPDHLPPGDVRELTGPLWELAENTLPTDRYGRPPTVYFLWGTRWNQRAIVAAVSERLEHFSSDGSPRRSWLRLRLLRVGRDEYVDNTDPGAPPVPEEEMRRRLTQAELVSHEPVGDNLGGERVDQIAARRLGHVGYWRLLAEISDLDNPLHLNRTLQIPTTPAIEDEGGPP